MGQIIRGKETADKIIEKIKQETDRLVEKPSLAVIIVGNNPASKLYVRKKKETAIKAGINSFIVEMPENISQLQLEAKIDELNSDPNVNALLVQLPLSEKIDSSSIIRRIKPEKDVDGFHPINVGLLATGMTPYAVSCTPAGIIELLKENNIQIESKHVVIIGRSNIVGKPLSYLMLKENASVTVCHSKSENIKSIAASADILISAVGIPKMIQPDWVKEGAVIVDVGINRNEEGKLCGDVDFQAVEGKTSFITPVPGGVGPMTIAMLLQNTLNLFKISKEKH